MQKYNQKSFHKGLIQIFLFLLLDMIWSLWTLIKHPEGNSLLETRNLGLKQNKTPKGCTIKFEFQIKKNRQVGSVEMPQ